MVRVLGEGSQGIVALCRDKDPNAQIKKEGGAPYAQLDTALAHGAGPPTTHQEQEETSGLSREPFVLKIFTH